MNRVKFKRDRGLALRMYLTMVLFALLYVGFGAVVWYFGASLFYVIPIAVGVLLLQFFMSDSIVLGASGARVVSEQDQPDLHKIVGELSQQAGLPKPRIALINTSMPNAFATGLTQRKALIAVTTGLMERLNRDELRGVLGHELAHIQNRDMRLMSVANFFVAITSFLLTILFFRSLFGGHDRNNNAAGAIMLIYLVTLIVYFLGTLLLRMLSRHREYLADYSGATLTGSPSALASALSKIHTTTQVTPKEQLGKLSTASALCIMPAYTKRDFASIFSTHPPFKERIKKLNELEKSKSIDYSYRWNKR